MRLVVFLGALSGALAVALGAFAAHGLSGTIPASDLAGFETGARYHLVHALAMVAAGLLAAHGGGRAAVAGGLAFLLGTVLFSGSLYVLGLTGSRALVLVTPVGGVAFILGWILVAVAALGANRLRGRG